MWHFYLRNKCLPVSQLHSLHANAIFVLTSIDKAQNKKKKNEGYNGIPQGTIFLIAKQENKYEKEIKAMSNRYK